MGFFDRPRQVLGAPQREVGVDVLRGLAALAVLIGHFEGIWPFFNTYGGLGVDLFFVLSGYLVSRPLVDSLEAGQRPRMRLFFGKRFSKILPSYLFFLVAGMLLAIILVRPFAPEMLPTWKEIPQYLFFYRNYGGPPPRLLFEHTWSLCVEEHFYLILPVICLLLWKFKREASLFPLAIFILVAGILIRLYTASSGFAEYPTYTHNRIDALAWGVLVTIMGRKWTKLHGKDIFLLLGVVMFPLGLWISDQWEGFMRLFFLHTLAPFSFALILGGLLGRTIPVWFNPLRWVAYYSYNLYLWHFFILHPVRHFIGQKETGFLVYAVLSGIFALLTTAFIEEPCSKLGRRWLNKISPPTDIKAEEQEAG